MELVDFILWTMGAYLSLWALLAIVWIAAVMTCRIRRWRGP